MEPYVSCLIAIVVNAICFGLVIGTNTVSHDPQPAVVMWTVIIFNSMAIAINLWCLIRYIEHLR